MLLVDCDPIDEAPVLDLRIRKGIRRHNVKLAVASARPTALDSQAVSVTRIPPGGAGALLADESSELAAWLRDAGEDLVIVYGERALAGDGAKALLNLATRLGLRGRDGAGLIEVPSVPNARGLREAGFAPGHGPGYSTLAEPGRDARGIAEGLASGELSTVWLNYADPVRFFPDRALWERALGTAQTVIAVESVMTETVREHADVVFPGEAYPEKEGTVTNLDGRVQRLRVAIGRPKGRTGMPGSGVRPVWQVISDARRSRRRHRRRASKQLFDAVPFYAGLTLDEIGGRGDPLARAASPSGKAGSPQLDVPAPSPARRRAGCGSARSARCGRPRRSTPRRSCSSRSRARWSSSRPSDAARARRRARATASQVGPNGTRVRGAVKLRAAVPAGSVFVAEGVPDEPANVLTEPLVQVERVGGPAEPSRRRCPRRSPRRRGPGRDAAVRLPLPPLRRTLMVFAEVGFYEAWWIQLLKGVLIFAVVFQLVPVVLLAERKLLGRFQHRYGPNRVGPFGILQPMADIGKLIFKQQFRPRTSVGWLFAIAPAISMMTAVATIAIIPFSDVVDIFGTDVGLYGVDPSVGILFAFAFGAIAFYGVMLGGWASGSKYSFLGSMRGAAQLISYEVAQGLALVGVIMMAGSLSLTEIVEAQSGLWYIVPQFVGFIDLPGRRLRRDQPAAVRPAGGRRRAGRRLQHRVRRRPLRRLLRRRVPEHHRRLGDHRDALPRRLAAPVRRPADVGRPDRRARQDAVPRLLLHLGAGDAAAAALRPAHVPGLEGVPAARDPERARDRDPGGDHLMPYNPDDRRGHPLAPLPGAVRSTYRAFGETLRGLKTTFARMVEGPKTIQYPEEKVPVYPRFRGRHKLHRFEDTGLEKCVGCSLCAAACPADCIRVVAAENTPENRVSAGERYAAVYEINLSRCIFCGYCEVACPFDAITMGHDYEMSDYNRSDLIFTKEMLLAEPLDRTPLRSAGE